ncbi:hypothetical protein PDIDSM_1168, partial [Penicillium digitatum]
MANRTLSTTPAPKAMLKRPKPANIDKGLTRAERAAIARLRKFRILQDDAGNAEDTAWATAAATSCLLAANKPTNGL